jgi:hypothetical protein
LFIGIGKMITIRFNFCRMVASFDSIQDLDRWVLNSDLNEPFMYTIHGHGGEVNFEKYRNQLLSV